MTCPHTHEQNHSIEQKHHHIVDMGYWPFMIMLIIKSQTSLPPKFWGEAFATTFQIINVLPTKNLNGYSPHVVLFNKIPYYSFYKVFGCSCFLLQCPYNKNKFDFYSFIFLFIRYSPQIKGYIFLSSNGKVYISRHIIFNEYYFPYATFANPF